MEFCNSEALPSTLSGQPFRRSVIRDLGLGVLESRTFAADLRKGYHALRD